MAKLALQQELTATARRQRLNKTQEEVLINLLKGLDNKGIAIEMGASLSTVKNTVTYLLKRFAVAGRVELVLYFVELSFYNNTKLPKIPTQEPLLPVGDIRAIY